MRVKTKCSLATTPIAEAAGVSQRPDPWPSISSRGWRERRKQLGGTLSGGELQMLAVARALILKRSLMLLDEPCMGLSPLLVKEIDSKGTTILLVEQNANMALKVAHRAYVLEVGSVAIAGSAADLAGDERVKAAYLGK